MRSLCLVSALCAAAWAAARGDAAPTAPLTFTAPKLAAPAIDGRLAPGEWDAAAAVTGFVALKSKRLAAPSPVVFVGFDARGLYVAARVPCPKGKTPVANAKPRDGAVWRDDSVEVFVAPTPGGTEYYQFSVNAAGAALDAKGKDVKWNAAGWTCKTSRSSGAWTAEFAIPWSAIGLTAAPPDVGFNAAWNCRTGWPGNYSWAPVERSFHEPQRFAKLRLRARGPALRLLELARPAPSRLKVTAEVVGGAPAFAARVVCPNKKTLSLTQNQPRVAHVFELPRAGQFLLGGDYAFEYSCGDVARGRVAFHVRPAVDLKLELRMLAGFADVTADLRAMGASAAGATLALALQREGEPQAKPVARLAVPKDRVVRYTLDMRPAAVGRYTLLASAAAANGKTLASARAALRKPPRPVWLGCKEGVTDKVFAPWTPVLAEGSTVRVWGRTYEFAAGLLPSKIVTRDKSVLAGSVTFVARVAGRVQRWEAKPARLVERKPDHATLDAAQESQGLRIEGRTRIDYDGMMRIDFTVAPKHPGEPVSLTLEVPIKPEHARYLYHFPGRWRSAFNVGALPANGWECHFKPYVWLGDEWRGLAWFCESDQHWRPDDPNKALQIAREPGRVVLRTHILHGVKLAKPLAFTIGFEATPVKPLRPDVWDYRIVHKGRYGLEKQQWSPRRTITWPAEGNIDPRRGTLEAWVRPHFDPDPPVKRNAPGRGRYNRNFFQLQFGGYTVGYYWNIDDRGMRFYVRAPNGRYPIILGARNRWKKGEWRHIAVSWGEEVRLYGDGKLLARRRFRGLLGRAAPQDLRGGKLILGTGVCEMDVDDFCISDAPRAPQGFAGPLKPNAHTLLLEPFDRLHRQPGAVQTVPAKAAGGAGLADRNVQLADGKFGRAAAFAHHGPALNVLDKYQHLGVRTICFHEHWTPVQNSHIPGDPAALRRLVRACHQHGIKLLLYFGYEMSNIHPDWDVYHVECLKHPRGGGYHRQPEQRDYIVCYNSPWQDYLAWAIAKTMDDFDIDGVYLDGTAHPHACDNKYHGCGYVDEQGRRRVTYGIFAARRMMRRIYAIVKSRKPDGEVNVHNSTMMVIPSLAWATSSWDGEQFGSIPRGPRFDEVIPLDAFRAEFMGQQWGVPAEFLCYNRPYTQREALAFTLLHDVLVRPYDVEFASKIWNAMARFGRRQARWLPYWENAQYVAASPAGVKVSLYSRGARGAMLVVSNLGPKPARAQVRLALDKLDLPAGRVAAEDALSGDPLRLKQGALTLSLQPMEWRLVRVAPR